MKFLDILVWTIVVINCSAVCFLYVPQLVRVRRLHKESQAELDRMIDHHENKIKHLEKKGAMLNARGR